MFPLDRVVLLPQQAMPLHIFEDRYRQMIRDALDGPGQIAMAVLRPGYLLQYHGNPPVMPVVCVGQIEQHETLADGRYNVLLRGLCRASVISEELPDDSRLYRRAYLQPIGLDDEAGPRSEALRAWMADAFSESPLSRLTVAEQIRSFVASERVPTSVLLELVSFAVIADPLVRYQILAEPSVDERAELIRGGLDELGALIRRALHQHPERWPKGCSWN